MSYHLIHHTKSIERKPHTHELLSGVADQLMTVLQTQIKKSNILTTKWGRLIRQTVQKVTKRKPQKEGSSRIPMYIIKDKLERIPRLTKIDVLLQKESTQTYQAGVKLRIQPELADELVSMLCDKLGSMQTKHDLLVTIRNKMPHEESQRSFSVRAVDRK